MNCDQIEKDPNEVSKLSNTNKMIVWNIIKYKKRIAGKKIIKVFLGGQNGVQVIPFKSAWQKINIEKDWAVQYITVGYINDMEWSPKDFVDWLLDSHIHIIPSHVHQGINDWLCWNMIDLENQLQRLKFHLGFPNLGKLKCPVFLQDKYKYLINLPMHKVNNTLQLYLTDDYTYYEFSNVLVMDRIKR